MKIQANRDLSLGKNVASNEYIFYYRPACVVTENIPIKSDSFYLQNKKFNITIWKPSLLSMTPKKFPLNLHQYVWWLLFFFLKKTNYCICVVYNAENELIHHAILFPKFFRFPFMRTGDFQIGNVWTKETYRNQNIAQTSINFLMDRMPTKNFWYITKSCNLPSKTLAKKLQFKSKFSGTKSPSALLGLVDTFVPNL